jgi:hypothetical protein
MKISGKIHKYENIVYSSKKNKKQIELRCDGIALATRAKKSISDWMSIGPEIQAT